MDVSIPQANLKPFAYAIQCLSKIGKELFIEMDGDQLILRTLNDSRSAFAAFYFQNGGFFESFDYQLRGDENSVTCKVLLKPVLQVVLRSLKRVLSLRLHLEDQEEGLEPHLVFDMQCDYSIVKRHQFCVEDCEIVHAIFNREGASYLNAPSSHLSQVLEHIYGTPEVCMYASADYLCFKSSRGMEAISTTRAEVPVNASLVTEMSIAAADFETYSFAHNGGDEQEDDPEEGESKGTVSMIFGLKEVKALLAFCDSTDCQSLSFYFHQGGRPVLFCGEEGPVGLELVLATADPIPPTDAPPDATQAPTMARIRQEQHISSKRSERDDRQNHTDEEGHSQEADDGTELTGRYPPTQGSNRSMASSAAAESLMVIRAGGGIHEHSQEVAAASSSSSSPSTRTRRRRALLQDSDDEAQ